MQFKCSMHEVLYIIKFDPYIGIKFCYILGGHDVVDYSLLIVPKRQGIFTGAVAFVAQAMSRPHRLVHDNSSIIPLVCHVHCDHGFQYIKVLLSLANSIKV